ncbi:PAS domain S-box [Dehalogenimonas alkenigignens]|uniref:histidine kinase n=1 Tax=Dehalogenimonas alkenigignens TaxID=1217799 RepID=A0A0W0GFV6_9CHLR|nr:PAS domain S-box protein [Dehalogenimonas alkenigignens]KTB47426.1 PAS domain S-box [Dehalogenimonas alkenigignens]
MTDIKIPSFTSDEGTEARIQHINQLLLAVRNINQLIIRNKNDAKELLGRASRILARDYGLVETWAMLFNHHGAMEFVAESGLTEEAQSQLNEILKRGAPPCVNIALESMKARLINNPSIICAGCPVSPHFLASHKIVVPLIFENDFLGTFVAIVTAQTVIGPKEFELLDEMARDIAFGLNEIDENIKRREIEHELRKYELIANNTKDIILFLSCDDGHILEANLAAVESYGYSREELLSRTISDLRAPDTRASVSSQIRQADSSGIIFETLHLRRDGSIFPVEVSSRGADILGGRMLVSVIRDITERKKAESILREVSEHQKTVLSTVPDMIVEVDLTKVYTWANPAAIAFFGSDMVGKEASFYFEGAQDTYHSVQPVFDGDEQTVYVESWQRRRDGQKRLLGWWCRPLKDSSGKVIGALSAAQDITERKQIEEKARRASREWRTTFDSMSDMISIQDRDFKITRVNKAYAEALGKPFREIIGKTCFELIHGTKTPIAGCPHLQTLKTGKPACFESFDPEHNNHSEVRTFPIMDDHRKVTFTIHVFHDITQRKLEEAEKQHLRDKAEMTSRLAAVGEMASGIAHEINNPLSGVIGFAELLLGRTDLPDDVRQDLETINEGSQRVKEIIRRMLTFARQQKPLRTCISVTDLIDNTLELRKYVLDTANIEVVRDYSPDMPALNIDPGQLQQVFLNLIVNAEYAMKKTHGRGRLTITARKDPDKFRFLFSDDGPGVPKEVRDKIFQPFFTTKVPGEGTGLGLSLSRGIVLEHAGDIVLGGIGSSGATFIVELPLGLACSSDTGLPMEVAAMVPTRTARVLVIDDEVSVRLFIEAMLVREGHSVETTETADEALVTLSNENYDMILLDIRMPGTSGIELFDQISSRWPNLAMRIVFTTGDTNDAVTSQFIAAKGVPCLAKPFDRQEVLNQLARLVLTSGSV